MHRQFTIALFAVVLGFGILNPVRPALAQGGPKPGQGPGRKPPTEEEKETARKRIGMSVQQQKDIEAIFAASDVQMQEIRTKMGDLYRQLWDMYGVYDFDRNSAQALRREMLGLHKKIMLQQLDNEEKIRKILNKEQFEKMRAMMKEDFERYRQKRGRPGGGPGGPNPVGGPKPPLH